MYQILFSNTNPNVVNKEKSTVTIAPFSRISIKFERSVMATRIPQMRKPPALVEVTFRMLASELGKEWKALATHLGLGMNEVERIQEGNPYAIGEQIHCMLMTWWRRRRHNNGDDARDELCNALVKCGRPDLTGLNTGLAENGNLDVCRQEFINFYKTTMGVIPLPPWHSSRVVKNEDIFVEVNLVENQQKPARMVQRIISHDEILPDLSLVKLPNNQILLYGIAGSGKTTIVSQIAYDWALQKPHPPLSKYRLLVALNLQELKSSSDLIGAIFDQILPRDTKVSPESLRDDLTSHADEVLVILDGVDEFGQKGSRLTSEGDIGMIISKKMLRGCTVIVTTRPHMIDELGRLNPQFALIELKGFSDSGIKEYIQKFFEGKEAEIPSELYRHLVASKSLKDLARSPMMLLMMCDVWLEKHELADSLTGLFEEAVLYVLGRHFNLKTSSQPVSECDTFIKNELVALVQNLGKAALEGLMTAGQKLVFETVTDFGDSCSVEKACQIGILSLERLRSKSKTQQNVTFLHKTFQEAMAGWYLAELSESDGDAFKEYLRQINEQNALGLEYVLRFCCGANVKAARSLLEHLVSKFTLEDDICSSGSENPEKAWFQERQDKTWAESDWEEYAKVATYKQAEIRLCLLMHLEAKSKELHTILLPLFKNGLVFNLDCEVDLRLAFMFLIDCTFQSSECLLNETQSALRTLRRVVFFNFFEDDVPMLCQILGQAVNVTNLGLELTDKGVSMKPESQATLGDVLFQMKSLENLSIFCTGSCQEFDLSALVQRVDHSDSSSSLLRFALRGVSVDPGCLTAFIRNHRQLCKLALINTCHEPRVPDPEDIHVQSLQELEMRHGSGNVAGWLCPKLEVLRIIENCLDEEDFRGAIFGILANAPELQVVDLSKNNIGKAFRIIAQKLAELANLEMLRLDETGLTPDQILFLTKSTLPRLTKLRVLSLSYNTMSPEAFLSVIQWSSHSSSLQGLFLRGCVRGDMGATKSSLVDEDSQTQTKLSSTEVLEVDGNDLGKSTSHFVRLLKQMPTLKTLNMKCMCLNDSRTELLTYVLQNCQHLQELRLEGNRDIGENGLEALLQLMPKLPRMKCLSLPINNDMPTGYSVLVDTCLAKGQSILSKYVEFERSQIEELINVLRHCKVV